MRVMRAIRLTIHGWLVLFVIMLVFIRILDGTWRPLICIYITGAVVAVVWLIGTFINEVFK